MKKILANLYIKAKTLSGEMSLSAGEIAKFLGAGVVGDPAARVKDMSSIAFASEGDITFARDEEELEAAGKSNASCVLTTVKKDKYPKTVVVVDDIKRALTMMYNAMLEIRPPAKGEVHPSAAVSEKAKLGRNVSVGPFAVIEDGASIGDNAVVGANCFVGRDVKVGASSRLYPNVAVYERTVIGDKVIVHSGTVIGADGFGYVPGDGKIYKVPQMGVVIIGDNVEIGANSCIDRGTFTDTVIGKGTKIDNLVQIAHNVKIGENNLIAGQVGIAGSVKTGNNVMMGGNAGIADHVEIGNNVKIAAKSGISGRVSDGTTLMRNPARSVTEALTLDRIFAMLIKHAPEFRRLLRKLPKEEGPEREAKNRG